MLRRLGAFLKASLAVVVLGLLTTVSAAIEPAHGQGRSPSARIPTLLVANQTANTIRSSLEVDKTWVTSPPLG